MQTFTTTVLIMAVSLAGCGPSADQRELERAEALDRLNAYLTEASEFIKRQEDRSLNIREEEQLMRTTARTGDYLERVGPLLEESRRDLHSFKLRQWDQLEDIVQTYPATQAAQAATKILEDEEREAAAALHTAKVRLRVNREAGQKLLRDVVNQHPRTEASKDARSLLE